MEQVYQKQIHYPSFNLRMFASVIDLIFATIILVPFLYYFTLHFVYKGTLPSSVINEAMTHMPTDIASISQLINAIFTQEAVRDYFFANHGWSKIFFDQLIQLITYSCVILFFWIKFSATPGKLLLNLKIVDEKTLKEPALWQHVVRFFGYFISAIPLCWGFFAIAFDPRGRAWHDRLSHTVVIKK